MSLPESFNNPKEYFEESMTFFKNNQHLYNFVNTSILSSNYFDNMNITGLEDLDLFDKTLAMQTIVEKNAKFRTLFEDIVRLTVDNGFIESCDQADDVNVPLGDKKKHEILHLAREIAEVCEQSGCSTVVDFGSGLGYLDQLIFKRSNFNVLGLECNTAFYTEAKRRQNKYHDNSLHKVKYKRHSVDENSDTAIEEYLRDKFPEQRGFCITGLHACADLTIDAINLFLKMADAKAIVLMSCCYHKMAGKLEDHELRFQNFPMSECLRQIFNKHKGYEYMKVPFLRLAAQQPNTKEDLKDLVFNLLARAVIQLYADTHCYNISRKKRKAVKTKIVANDFEGYMLQADNGFQLRCRNGHCVNTNTAADKTCGCKLKLQFEELRNLWREFTKDEIIKKAAIFVLLQRHLQPVFENFIWYDRLVYMQEKLMVNCRVTKIVNETISPRCLALLATK